MPYLTIAGRAVHEANVKGSRFHAVVAPAGDADQATALVNELRARHPGASHHCSAWRVGEKVAFDDDGEPAGTAGRPMLEVLLKRDLDRVAVVCVRYFGGTKLGAGGLVRAYGGTVAKALDAAGATLVHDTAALLIHAPFDRLDALHRLLDAWPDLVKGDAAYDPTGVRIAAVMRADELEAFEARLADVTAGAALVGRPGQDDIEE